MSIVDGHISHLTTINSRYQPDPGESHWTTVRNILKYLRRTKDVFLVYGGEEELVVMGYTDASFKPTKMIQSLNRVTYLKKVVARLAGRVPSRR
jgi:PleD family two-component response regulator